MSSATPRPTRSPRPSSSSSTVDAAELRASFAELQTNLSGEAGIAVVPVGGGSVFTAGGNQEDIAWSTAKVPIAIAALKKDDSSYIRQQATAAITWSDNDAARNLFRSLGGIEEAGEAVDAVLRTSGDERTSFARQVVKEPVASFGLTPWRLSDSARFASTLPCRADAKRVYSLMGQIEDDQQWGLGTIDRAHFKGGWGDVDAGFLSRQLGVVELPDGSRVGIAIMVLSPNGEEAADDDLTDIAMWFSQHADDFTGGHC